MGLCLDNECKNRAKEGEDYCLQYFDSQKYETDDEEIYKMNLNKYYKEVIDKYYVFDFENIIKNINYKTYTYEDYISDIVNIEDNIIKIKNERRNKKYIKKFNDKYNKLIKTNEDVLIWIENNFKTDYYKDKVIEIINENMYILEQKIEKYGKDIEFIRYVYKWMFTELVNAWEYFDNTEPDDKHDFKLCYKTETWKMYAIHEDDDVKKMLKI